MKRIRVFVVASRTQDRPGTNNKKRPIYIAMADARRHVVVFRLWDLIAGRDIGYLSTASMPSGRAGVAGSRSGVFMLPAALPCV